MALIGRTLGIYLIDERLGAGEWERTSRQRSRDARSAAA
jgi:hypothetical protein